MTLNGKLAVTGSAAAVALAAIVPAALGDGATASKSKVVSVMNDFFATDGQQSNRTKTTIEKGDSVTWKWREEQSNPHDVTFTSYPDGLAKEDRPKNSRTKESGEHKVRFSKRTGTYRYECTIHSPDMRGKVVVTKPD